MEKRERAETFGDWAAVAIAKHTHKMLQHEREVLEDQDPEALHQMRVGMRRLRTALTGFAPALKLPKPAQEKNVAKVARQLGELRDLDVLQESLEKQYQPELPPSEQTNLQVAFKHLAKQRRHALEQVQATLHSKRYLRLKQGLQEWLDQPRYQEIGAISIYEVLPDLLLPQVSKLLVHPGWLVGIRLEAGEIYFPETLTQAQAEQLLESEGETLHSLRKQAKRTRYQMELFTQFYGTTYKHHIKAIKKIQSVLGQVQDATVLAEFLAEAFASNLNSEVPTLANQLTNTRYQKWQDWQSLQRQFLDSQLRQDLRMAVQQPLSELVAH